MADIFNRNVSEIAGVFTTDRAKLLMAGNLGVLVQSMNFNYAQNITRLYEVGANGANGTNNIYYVGGRTQGNLAVNRVIGPKGTVQDMYKQYGDVCLAKGNRITLTLSETDCSESGQKTSASYSMANCVITNVAIGVQSQDMVIGENTTFMFSTLENVDVGAVAAITTTGVVNATGRRN